MRRLLAQWGSPWALTLEVCVMLYFLIGKTGFEPRLAIGAVGANQLLQLVVIGCLAAIPWMGSPARLLASRGLALLATLTALLWVGSLDSQNVAYMRDKPVGFAGIVLPCMALLVAHVTSTSVVRRLLVIWCIAGTVMMLAGVCMLALGMAPARLAVAGGGANVYARIVASALLVAVGLGIRPRGSRGWALASPALAGFALTLVAAGSKTALLGLGFALVGFGLYLHRWRLVLGAVAATTIFALSPVWLHPLVGHADKDRGSVRMFRLPDTDDPRGSYGTRLAYYRSSLELLRHAGLKGVGTGDWATALHLPSGRRYPHNMVLEVGCELGISGLLVLAAIVGFGGRWLRDLRRTEADPRLPATLVALLLFWLFNAQLSGDLLDNRNVWWPLLMLEILWVERCSRRSEQGWNALVPAHAGLNQGATQ